MTLYVYSDGSSEVYHRNNSTFTGTIQYNIAAVAVSAHTTTTTTRKFARKQRTNTNTNYILQRQLQWMEVPPNEDRAPDGATEQPNIYIYIYIYIYKQQQMMSIHSFDVLTPDLLFLLLLLSSCCVVCQLRDCNEHDGLTQLCNEDVVVIAVCL